MANWSSPAMAQVAELIRERSGLTFPEIRVRDVEASVQRAMQKRAISGFPELLRVLGEDAAARDALVAELTIGETYFQRDPAQFELLRNRIMPKLLARSPDRPVRVWSAGCASGEEPYSIAMLLEEFGAIGRGQIVGTDIARPRLADAQRGVYSKWSLRGTSDELRERYFLQRGRYYELIPRIRERVEFRYLNLAEDQFPSLAAGIWGMDLILCRNVLIYFDRDTVERVARRLIASLSEDGWLVLGASDPAIAEQVACDAVLTSAGLVYRRPGAAADEGSQPFGTVWTQGGVPPAVQPAPDLPAPPSELPPRTADTPPPPSELPPPGPDMPPPAPELPPPGPDLPRPAPDLPPPAPESPPATESQPTGSPDTDQAEAPAGAQAGSSNGAPAGSPPVADAGALNARVIEAYARRDFDEVARSARMVPATALSEQAWVAWLRALANQGCLEEAGVVAARALDAFGSTAELLYLHAVLLLEADRPADAAAAARRALYMDRTMVVAHLTLADAQRRGGNTEASARSLRNAASLLATLSPDAQVPAADGDTAGRLAELVNVRLRLLNEAA